MLSKIDKYERINLLEGIFAEKMSDESKKLTENPEFKTIVDSSKLKPMDIQSFEDSLDRINDIVRQIAMEQETSQEDRNVLNTFIGNTTVIRELYRKSDPEHPCVVNVGLTSLVLVTSVLSASRATVCELVCELGGINDVLAGSFIDQLKNGELSVQLSNMVIEPTTGSVESLDTNVVMNMASQIQEHTQLQESEEITPDVSLVAPIVLSSVFLILLTKMIRKANVFASTEDKPYSSTGKEILEVYKVAVSEAEKSTPVLVAWLKDYLDVTG